MLLSLFQPAALSIGKRKTMCLTPSAPPLHHGMLCQLGLPVSILRSLPEGIEEGTMNPRRNWLLHKHPTTLKQGISQNPREVLPILVKMRRIKADPNH